MSRAAAMLHQLDRQSRWHLQTFLVQLLFLGVFALPALLIDRRPPVLYLSHLQEMFGFSAVVLVLAGVLTRQGLSRSSIGYWDHALAFLLLKLGCGLVLRLVA